MDNENEPCGKNGKSTAENIPPPSLNGDQSLPQHQTAIAALASLPLKIIVSVFRHQWHKDKARITFAHAEQYMREHDLPVVKIEHPNLISKHRPRRAELHTFQLRLLKEDLKDPITSVRAENIRKILASELRISIPKDLPKVYYGKVPDLMDAAIDPGEFKDLVDHFGAERHPMILVVPMTLHLWSVHQDYPDLLPKNPAPWDWTIPASIIEANHWKSKDDLL
ncbi:hypothetical protein F5Y04DRAFT_289066 [Hypomontagnella monticulosa]|nr:hypothetical protein F5Y04DRAFT_289066 [Hypomontagnella monticulosa]